MCSGSLSPRLCATRPCVAVSQARNRASAHLGVDEPEHVLGLLLGDALRLKVLGDRLGDADTGRAGAEEEDALVAEGESRDLESADRTREDDSASALNVWTGRQQSRARAEQDGPSLKHG